MSKTSKTTSLDQHLIKSLWLLVLICFLKAVQSKKSSIKIYATSEESLFSQHELIFTRRNSFSWATDVPTFACAFSFFQMEGCPRDASFFKMYSCPGFHCTGFVATMRSAGMSLHEEPLRR